MSGNTSGVSHLGIGVSDVDRSVRFYTEVLGFSLVERYTYKVPNDPTLADNGNARPDATWQREVAVIRSGADLADQVIVMSRHDGAAAPHRVEMDDIGTHHVGFWVTGIEEYVGRLSAAGAEWVVPLRTFESGRAWGMPASTVKSCIFRDPDGTMIQLDEVLPAT